MSVISVKTRRTTDQAEFDRNRRSDASVLLTDAKEVSEFSVELTLGELYDDEISESRSVMYAIENDALDIRAGSSVVVEVAEYMRVPNNMFGLVMPKGHIFMEQGILMATAKIEPSYSGRLRVLLHNASRVRRSIPKGSVIASAVFFRTERTLEGDALTTREPVTKKPRGLLKKITSAIVADPRFVLMFLATLCSSIIGASLTLWFTRKPR